MLNNIDKVGGLLNLLTSYKYQWEDQIEQAFNISRDIGLKQSKVLETRCSLTARTVMALFGVTECKATDKLTSNCYVALTNKNNSNLDHCLCYINGRIYHSYIGRFTLRITPMEEGTLNKLLANPIEFMINHCQDSADLNPSLYKQRFNVEYFDINPQKTTLSSSCQELIKFIEKNRDIEPYNFDDFLYIFGEYAPNHCFKCGLSAVVSYVSTHI